MPGGTQSLALDLGLSLLAKVWRRAGSVARLPWTPSGRGGASPKSAVEGEIKKAPPKGFHSAGVAVGLLGFEASKSST